MGTLETAQLASATGCSFRYFLHKTNVCIQVKNKKEKKKKKKEVTSYAVYKVAQNSPKPRPNGGRCPALSREHGRGGVGATSPASR